MTRELLGHLVRERQARDRLPSVSAALLRDGELVWRHAAGVAAAGGDPATPDHRYRIGSITKTFTAALVMQLVDAGRVDLDDPLDRHLPEWKGAGPTVRGMLAHRSGMQREIPGDAWLTMKVPDMPEMLERLADAEQVIPPGERWHYSNLAYALLGEIVARAHGQPYEQIVSDRLLEPVGLAATGFDPDPPLALGYFVRPYTDEAIPQADPPMRAFSAAGGLYSTASDICRWADVFVSRTPELLSEHAVDRMHLVHAMMDHQHWTLGWGLGLELHRRGERMLAGHDGGMPGYLSGVVWSRSDRVACAVLTSSGASGDPTALALELVDAELRERPATAPGWEPGDAPPGELDSVLGHWWTEGFEFVFSFRKGRLEARAPSAPADRPPAVFERIDADTYRVASGREHGELLLLERDADGTVVRMRWAGYPVTRTHDPFVSD